MIGVLVALGAAFTASTGVAGLWLWSEIRRERALTHRAKVNPRTGAWR